MMAVWFTSMGIFIFTDQQASLNFETDLVELGYLNGRHTVWFDVVVVNQEDAGL